MCPPATDEGMMLQPEFALWAILLLVPLNTTYALEKIPRGSIDGLPSISTTISPAKTPLKKTFPIEDICALLFAMGALTFHK